MRESVKNSVKQSANQCIKHWVSQSVSQLLSQSVSLFIRESGSQSISQSTSQVISPLVNHISTVVMWNNAIAFPILLSKKNRPKIRSLSQQPRPLWILCMEWKHEVGNGTDKDSNGSFLGRHFSRDYSVAGGQVGHRIGQNGCDKKNSKYRITPKIWKRHLFTLQIKNFSLGSGKFRNRNVTLSMITLSRDTFIIALTKD